ncbi:MAG: hypothetical protein U0694_16500 [Anaerolineae bacterium]
MQLPYGISGLEAVGKDKQSQFEAGELIGERAEVDGAIARIDRP